MVFTDFMFYIFLTVVFGLTYSAPEKLRQIILLAGSYLFYMYWKANYIWIVIALTAIDYLIAPLIERSSGKARTFFWCLSLAGNLGLLFTFKYLGFFAREINSVLSWLHAGGAISVPDLILPLGISFHTFQAISYTTDVYRGHLPAERNPFRFALFIAWFPQMVAGPIERANTLLVQLGKINFPPMPILREGLILIMWGLFKKLVLADNVAVYNQALFNSPKDHSQLLSWLVFYAYALQIYCDFSGYTDIAKGSSLLFAIKLSENFNRPYASRSFIEFWKRWHMTLSNWFFEYVFYPLARRFPSTPGLTAAIMLTFVLSGLWHGANWTFLIWGALNGIIYLAYVFAPVSFPVRWGDRWRVFLNFNLVCLCWVFFASPSATNAIDFLKLMVAGSDTTLSSDLGTFFNPGLHFVSVFIGIAAFYSVEKWELNFKCTRDWKMTAIYFFLAIAFISTLGRFHREGFIYFQF